MYLEALLKKKTNTKQTNYVCAKSTHNKWKGGEERERNLNKHKIHNVYQDKRKEKNNNNTHKRFKELNTNKKKTF